MSKSEKGTKKKNATKKKSTTKKTTPKTKTKKTATKKTKKATKPVKASTKTVKKSSEKSTRKKKASTKKKKSVTTKESEILRELEIELASDDEQVCFGAVGRLSTMKGSKATEILISGLKHPRHMVRIHVAVQLGERKDKKAVDALIESLHDDSVFVRQSAAGALENIGTVKGKKAVAKAEKEGILLDELPEGKRLPE